MQTQLEAWAEADETGCPSDEWGGGLDQMFLVLPGGAPRGGSVPARRLVLRCGERERAQRRRRGGSRTTRQTGPDNVLEGRDDGVVGEVPGGGKWIDGVVGPDGVINGIRWNATHRPGAPRREARPAHSARQGGRRLFHPDLMRPITQEVMSNPVRTVDGHILERDAIETWFHGRRRTREGVSASRHVRCVGGDGRGEGEVAKPVPERRLPGEEYNNEE